MRIVSPSTVHTGSSYVSPDQMYQYEARISKFSPATGVSGVVVTDSNQPALARPVIPSAITAIVPMVFSISEPPANAWNQR